MRGDLNEKQLRFVQELLVDDNGTQAAIRAGYAPKGAAVTASRMLNNAKIQAAVQAARAERAKRTGITADWVLTQIASIATDAERDSDRLKALELLGKHLGLWEQRRADDESGVRVVMAEQIADWSE